MTDLPLDQLNRLVRSSVFFDIVEQVFGVSKKQLIAYSSRPRIVRARYAFYVLMAVYTEHSLAAIARKIQRDHSTVSSGIRTGYPRYSGGAEFSGLMNEAVRLLKQTAGDVLIKVRENGCFEDLFDCVPATSYGIARPLVDIGQFGGAECLRPEAPGRIDEIGPRTVGRA